DDVGLFIGDFLRVGGEYLLYCTAVGHDFWIDLDKGISRVGKCTTALATTDGVSFRRVGDQPLLGPMTGASVVVEHDGLYHMFFNRLEADESHNICVVRSSDPLRFDIKESRVALERGRAGEGDAFQVQNPRFLHEKGVWYMVYAG